MALRQVERINYEELTDRNSCGIYGIYVNTRLVYIGQSTQMETRWKAHTSYIVSGNIDRSSNGIRQSVLHFLWDNGFEISFKVLCVCEKEELNKIEKEYIEIYQPMFNGAYNPNPLPIPAKTRHERYCEWKEYREYIKEQKKSRRGK